MSEQERMELARAIEKANEADEYITISKDRFHRAMAAAVAKEVSEDNAMLNEKGADSMDPMLSILFVILAASAASKAWDILTGKEDDSE